MVDTNDIPQEVDIGFYMVEKMFTIQHATFTKNELVKLKQVVGQDEVRICKWLTEPSSSLLFPSGLKDNIRKVNYQPNPNFNFDYAVKHGTYEVVEEFVSWGGRLIPVGTKIQIHSYNGYVRIMDEAMDLIGVEDFNRLRYIGK